MAKYIVLDYDISSPQAEDVRSKYSIKSFSNTIHASTEYDGEIISPEELAICTALDVNRFRIYCEYTYGEKVYYTGWIINRKIYLGKELTSMGIILPNDSCERYFLTLESQPIPVGKKDESVHKYLVRVERKLEEQKQRKQEGLKKEPKKSVAKQKKPKSGNNTTNGGLFPRQTAIAPAKIKSPKKDTEEAELETFTEEHYIEYQTKPDNDTVRESSNYVKVDGRNIAVDFNNEQVIEYFLNESVVRTRFYKQRMTKDYAGNPIPGKKMYETGWIYNGEVYDIKTACELGIISSLKAELLHGSGFSKIVFTKSKLVYPLGNKDTTFDEYLEKCFIKEGITLKKGLI